MRSVLRISWIAVTLLLLGQFMISCSSKPPAPSHADLPDSVVLGILKSELEIEESFEYWPLYKSGVNWVRTYGNFAYQDSLHVVARGEIQLPPAAPDTLYPVKVRSVKTEVHYWGQGNTYRSALSIDFDKTKKSIVTSESISAMFARDPFGEWKCLSLDRGRPAEARSEQEFTSFDAYKNDLEREVSRAKSRGIRGRTVQPR